MRKAWFNLLTLGALISAGACAAGTEVQGGASNTTSTTSTQSNTEDSGTASTSTGGQGSDDAGSSQLPPAGEDSGSAQQTPSQDSGTSTTQPQDSGSSTTPLDAGTPPTSDDSGAGSGTTCPATTANGLTWLGVTGTVPVCSTNADCSAGECCYVPTGISIVFGSAACITPQ
jgi:hypothetical protein